MVSSPDGGRLQPKSCPKPFTGGQPCYSRKCACLDCRNKCTWREYTLLVRSLERLPATHFLSVNFPPLYYGFGVTARMNQFVKLLARRVGAKIVFHWRYDGQVKGRWPHAHILARCAASITSEDVLVG